MTQDPKYPAHQKLALDMADPDSYLTFPSIRRPLELLHNEFQSLLDTYEKEKALAGGLTAEYRYYKYNEQVELPDYIDKASLDGIIENEIARPESSGIMFSEADVKEFEQAYKKAERFLHAESCGRLSVDLERVMHEQQQACNKLYTKAYSIFVRSCMCDSSPAGTICEYCKRNPIATQGKVIRTSKAARQDGGA